MTWTLHWSEMLWLWQMLHHAILTPEPPGQIWHA